MEILTIGVNVYPWCKCSREGCSMLKINRQTDYAVRILLALAKQGQGARLSSAVIQQEMLIPAALMPRIRCRWCHCGSAS